jgi:hypothetical protein
VVVAFASPYLQLVGVLGFVPLGAPAKRASSARRLAGPCTACARRTRAVGDRPARRSHDGNPEVNMSDGPGPDSRLYDLRRLRDELSVQRRLGMMDAIQSLEEIERRLGEAERVLRERSPTEEPAAKVLRSIRESLTFVRHRISRAPTT